MRGELRPGRDAIPTPVGLQLPDKPMHFEQWRDLGEKLGMLHNGSTWALADWAVYGSTHYSRSEGDRYAEAMRLTGLERQTVKNYASVARRIPLKRRRPKLSYVHHSLVVWLPEEAQEELLDSAEREGWGVRQLREHVLARPEKPTTGRPRRPLEVTRTAATGDEIASTPREPEQPSVAPAARAAPPVTLDVDETRRARWESAAKGAGLDLATWLARIADEAAAVATSPVAAAA